MATRKAPICKLCRERPAAVPDRNTFMGGRFVRQVCSECHMERLRGDFRRVMAIHDEKHRKAQG